MDYRTLPPPVAALERRLGLDEGTLEGADKARAEDALSDASELVLLEAGRRADAWRTNPPSIAVIIALKAARREWDNPEGNTQETLGEHTIGTSNTSGIYLTADERQTLRRAAGNASSVRTLRTPSAYDFGATTWVTPTAYPDGTPGGPMVEAT